MGSGLSWKIRNAAFDFRSKRGEFYLDLASAMLSSPGETITRILKRYADRYQSETVGILCSHWLDRFAQVGTFSQSVEGTVPTEDLATLISSESSGDLQLGLEKLGKNIIAMKKCRTEMNKAMMTGALLVIILHVYFAVEAFGVMPKMEAAMRGNVDIAMLGRTGAILFGGSKIIRDWWWLYAIFAGGLVGIVIWAIKNYTGKGRRWLDENFLPFQIARDFNAAGFFTTIGTITTPRSGHVVQLSVALNQLANNAFPWLKWQIRLMLDNLSAHPNSKGEIFNTGISGKRIYYRILDISDYKEVPAMLQEIGGIILETAPEEIKARAKKLTVVLTAICLLTMLFVHGATFGLIEAFKTAAMLKSMH